MLQSTRTPPVVGRPRRRAATILVTLFVVVALVVGGVGGFYVWATGGSAHGTPVSLEVPSGSTTADIATLLHDKGVIRSGFMFRLLARFKHLGASIEAGKYDLTTGMSLSAAFDALNAGPKPVVTETITIPEGFELDQIAGRAHDDLGVSRKKFVDLATSGRYTLPPYLPDGARTLEGFLFPKTYEFPVDPAADDVIQTLLDQFKTDAGGLPWKRAGGLGISPYEAVIVASLVEREARVPADRPKIARVIYNRLAKGMPLQIDATVQYGLPEHKARLTYDDLQYPSPYNTYLHSGLPPTPIANPGLPSLRAALHPADGNWLYFLVIDAAGTHGFTDSYDEFLRLKAQVQGG